MTSLERTAAGASNFERNILLLDGKEHRQVARAAAMRRAGATVRCVADGAAARDVWRPGSYQLVIIEFEGGGADVREFYEYASTLSPGQAFGFYTNVPPYLSHIPRDVPRRSAGKKQPSENRLAAGVPTSLQRATQRIAFSRASRRIEPASRSFSDAVKAAENEARALALEAGADDLRSPIGEE